MGDRIKREDTKFLKPYKDLLIISIFSILIFIVGSIFDLSDKIGELASRIHHQMYPFDEVLTLLIFLFFAFIFFSWRRWRDLKNEISESRSRLAQIRLLAQTVISVKDSVSITDLDNKILFVNEAFLNTYGYSENELIGSEISKIRPSNIIQKVTEEILPATMAGGWHGEVLNVKKDGTVFPVELWTSIVNDEAGKPVAMVGVARDITERKYAEEELRKLSLAVEQSPISIVITDINGTIEYVNPKFSQITGYTLEEVIGGNPRILKSGKTSPVTYKQLWDTITSGNEWHGEFQNKKKNGELFWENALITPIINDAGVITHFLGVKEDITLQKEAERRLQESETKYRIVADNTYNWEFWLDPSGNFIYSSPSCKQITGFDSSEFIKDKKLLMKIIHSEDKAIFGIHRLNVSNKMISEEIEFRIIHADGTERWIVHSCQPVFDDKGIFIGTRGSNRDETERKRMEEALLRNEMQISAAQQISNLGSWDVDLQSNEVAWSDQLYRIMGFKPRECLASLETFMQRVHTDDRNKVKNKIENALRNYQPFNVEYRLIRIDGYIRIASTNGFVLINDTNEPVRIYGTVHDITERRKVEDEKEKLLSELQEALKNIKTLSGLIPICASCKKIRDDKGYWNQLEEYVVRHSDASFSHGICPDCIDKLYPKYADKVKNMNNVKNKDSNQ